MAKSHKTMYGVQFIGYTAFVFAKSHDVEIQCAQLDFVTGCALLSDDEGFIIAPNLGELGQFVHNLPQIVAELEELLKQLATSSVGEVCREPYSATLTEAEGISIAFPSETEILVSPGTNLRRFIRKVGKRFAQISGVLEQAEKIGASINRRPYDEYIDEIDRTGLCRVECRGFAFLIDGNLQFYPARRTVLNATGG